MKIRKGFVSNSSSSSFMIYGGSVDLYDDNNLDYVITKIMEKLNDKEIEEFKKYVYDDGDPDDIDKYELREYTETLVPKGYSIETGYDADYMYIGVSPSRQPDDQNHGDWKKEIQTTLNGLFGEAISGYGWKEDCWRDG